MSSSHHHYYHFHFFLLLPSLLTSLPLLTATAPAPASPRGKWQLLQQNIGIVAMHMQLLHTDRVVIFDRTDFGPSNLSLPSCRSGPDCTAHSIEYNVALNTFRPLTVLSDVWCSSGAVSPDGTLIQTGGYKQGERVVRTFKPCRRTPTTPTPPCDWEELGDQLLSKRWYATNHILPDGQVIIVGGRRAYNYEFYPKSEASRNLYSLRFLVQTNDAGIENNLYPFIFLNSDGNLFIFANNKSILFDYGKNAVVRTYPDIPGGGSRCYPSTGSAVLLPIRDQGQTSGLAELEVMVCGGTVSDAYVRAKKGHEFVEALNTCGRMRINDPNPNWEMETMPMPRFMGDMLILPNGRVLIINGARSGSAGWEFGRGPVLEPVLYNPDWQTGPRFVVQAATTIPRMYHSGAIVLRDGRVLVGGHNPHKLYNFTDVLFPTELRLESFSPEYLDPSFAYLRPEILSPGSQSRIGYGQTLYVRFRVPGSVGQNSTVPVTLFSPPFNTHSFSMNHRMLVLGAVGGVTAEGGGVYGLSVTTPGTANLASKGYYLMFVVHQDIPSEGIWVRID